MPISCGIPYEYRNRDNNQIITNNQIQITKSLVIGYFILEFVWDLYLGYWKFIRSLLNGSRKKLVGDDLAGKA